MKCPKCNGIGKILTFNYDLEKHEVIECPKCHGSGKKPITNEEWFCGLSTEEKAKWLSRNSKFMYGCGRMETTPKIMYEEAWEWWLKQPHTSKE